MGSKRENEKKEKKKKARRQRKKEKEGGKMREVKTKMEAYQTKITTCKTDDSCTCWTEATDMKSEITECKATDEMNRVKALKGSCLEKFGDCKKAQDSAVELTASCPTTSVTTGAPSMTTMAAKHRDLLDKLLARNLIKH